MKKTLIRLAVCMACMVGNIWGCGWWMNQYPNNAWQQGAVFLTGMVLGIMGVMVTMWYLVNTE